MGRGGACVPARAAPQGRIHRLFPAHNTCVFLYGNAAVRTFGRAHRHRPYAFRLGRLRVDDWRHWCGLRVSVEWRLGGLCIMLGHVV